MAHIPKFLSEKKSSITKKFFLTIFLLILFIESPFLVFFLVKDVKNLKTSFKEEKLEKTELLVEVLQRLADKNEGKIDKAEIEKTAELFSEFEKDIRISIKDQDNLYLFHNFPLIFKAEKEEIEKFEIKTRDKDLSLEVYFLKKTYKEKLRRISFEKFNIFIFLFILKLVFISIVFRLFLRSFLDSLDKALLSMGKEDYNTAFNQSFYPETEKTLKVFYQILEKIRKSKAELINKNEKLKLRIRAKFKTEKKLKLQEDRQKILFKAIPDIIFLFDERGNFLDFLGPENNFLLKDKDFINKNIREIFKPSLAELMKKHMATALKTEKDQSFEYRLTKNEKIEHFETRLINGKNKTIVAIIRNISEEIEAEKTRKKMEKRLARAEKMEAIGVVAGGVAHDLNNVLAGLVSYPELLLQDMDKDDPMYRKINIIYRSGQKAARIVQDLLTLARRGVPNVKVVQLNQLIREYLSSPEYEKALSYHPGVILETELDAELPLLKGSDIHLSKMLMNLVSNAMEAMPEGGLLSITTSFSSEKEENFPQGYIKLVVKDTGIGMDTEDKERLFEPFYTKKVMGRSGTGLGMAVVLTSVQDHKGEIKIESLPREGCAIKIKLPVFSESSLNFFEDNIQLKGRGEHIFVIDDLPEQREIASMLLKRLGYRVSSFNNGEEALKKLPLLEPDLVLLDMMMGAKKADGLEIFRNMRTLAPGIKVILLTAFSEKERIKEALGLGAMDYIQKPYTINALAESIYKALHRSKTYN